MSELTNQSGNIGHYSLLEQREASHYSFTNEEEMTAVRAWTTVGLRESACTQKTFTFHDVLVLCRPREGQGLEQVGEQLLYIRCHLCRRDSENTKGQMRAKNVNKGPCFPGLSSMRGGLTACWTRPSGALLPRKDCIEAELNHTRRLHPGNGQN